MKLFINSPDPDDVLVCYNSIFDPSLATLSQADGKEGIVILKYDALEYGNPLDLPILMRPGTAMFNVKFTPTGVHTSLFLSDFEDDTNIKKYLNEVGDLEYNVRFTDEEKTALFHRIAFLLIERNTL